MSKDEFRRKERNREAIFAGYIRNRKVAVLYLALQYYGVDCRHFSFGFILNCFFVSVFLQMRLTSFFSFPFVPAAPHVSYQSFWPRVSYKSCLMGSIPRWSRLHLTHNSIALATAHFPRVTPYRGSLYFFI